MSSGKISRRDACKYIGMGAASLPLLPKRIIANGIGAQKSSGERIKAFCIDFNWSPELKFAPVGMYGHASAKEHFAWYKDMNVNTIQTFCVNTSGYAWYKSSVPPVTPGLQGDFLREITEMGHNAGMRVLGYFVPCENTYWGKTYPHLSHGAPDRGAHIPFTTEYIDYMCRSIEDVLSKIPIDGFMLDGVGNTAPKWMECEQTMYEELFGEKFPGKDKINKDTLTEFQRRATDRAWEKIRETSKSMNDKIILWANIYNLKSPAVAQWKIFREADWFMNENPDMTLLEPILKEARGIIRHDAVLLQCLSGGGEGKHDAAKIIEVIRDRDIGLYGFAMADVETTIPPAHSDHPHYAANAKNIEVIRQVFREL